MPSMSSITTSNTDGKAAAAAAAASPPPPNFDGEVLESEERRKDRPVRPPNHLKPATGSGTNEEIVCFWNLDGQNTHTHHN